MTWPQTLCSLFSDLVNDSLTEYTYDADLAGLAYNFGAQSLGVSIFLNGYNDKLPDLTRRIIGAARNLHVRQDRLEVMKEKVGGTSAIVMSVRLMYRI